MKTKLQLCCQNSKLESAISGQTAAAERAAAHRAAAHRAAAHRAAAQQTVF